MIDHLHRTTETGCYFLCGVEGCPRTQDTQHGQDQGCGLVKLAKWETIPESVKTFCAAQLTVDHWFDFSNGEMNDRPCEYKTVEDELNAN